MSVKERPVITKERLAADLNKIFGSEIAFQKLSVQELQQLTDIVKTPIKFLQAGRRAASIKWSEDVLNAKVGDILKSRMNEDKESGDDRGPLGLGILPGITQRIKSFTGVKSEAQPQPEQPDS